MSSTSGDSPFSPWIKPYAATALGIGQWAHHCQPQRLDYASLQMRRLEPAWLAYQHVACISTCSLHCLRRPTRPSSWASSFIVSTGLLGLYKTDHNSQNSLATLATSTHHVRSELSEPQYEQKCTGCHNEACFSSDSNCEVDTWPACYPQTLSKSWTRAPYTAS